jgi:hypothetical protein
MRGWAGMTYSSPLHYSRNIGSLLVIVEVSLVRSFSWRLNPTRRHHNRNDLVMDRREEEEVEVGGPGEMDAGDPIVDLNAGEALEENFGAGEGFVFVSTLERAVAVLQQEENPTCPRLKVTLRKSESRIAAPTAAERAVERATRSEMFRRFVELLGDPNGRAFSMLVLDGFRFVPDEGFRTEDLRRLFGDVLPKKQGLRSLSFENCEVDSTLMNLFTSAVSMTTNSTASKPALTFLDFSCVQLDQDGLAAIAELLKRHDSPLTRLHLSLIGMGPAACMLICGCLPHNTTLKHLGLDVDKVTGDALDHVAGATTSLKNLYISTSWTPDAVQSLANQLRTNTSLEGLYLNGASRQGDPDVGRSFERLEETLRTYNYTLSVVSLVGQWNGVDTSGFQGYLQRNKRIRRGLRRLPPVFDPSLPVRIWPAVLEIASGLPSLTYKLLRRGDINALCDVLHGRNDGSSSSSKEPQHKRQRWEGSGWIGRQYYK